MTDFWLISVPLDKTSLTNIDKLKRSIAKTNQASCCKFLIPDLKVGILDSLVSVSDDLSRLDTVTESVVKKTGQCMKEVMELSCEKRLEKALANGDDRLNEKMQLSPLESYFQSLKVDLVAYVTRFQWDKAKYATSLPLSVLTDVINKEVTLVETELKSRSTAYNSLKSNLQNLELKHQGALQSRCLNNIVRKEDLVVSEYLTTLLVIVNRGSFDQWEKTYESLSDFVVPRSSRSLYEDAEAGIFSVTLFKRAVSQFKANAQESKFTVREYCVELEEQKLKDMKQLSAQKKEQHGIYLCWLKVNYRQLFVAWIHLKALRVFVESVLRYGLPVNFQALLLQTDKKRSKKMREELASLFVHLDPPAMTGKTDNRRSTFTASKLFTPQKSQRTIVLDEVSCDIPGLCQQEYFSYISVHINTTVLELS